MEAQHKEDILKEEEYRKLNQTGRLQSWKFWKKAKQIRTLLLN